MIRNMTSSSGLWGGISSSGWEGELAAPSLASLQLQLFDVLGLSPQLAAMTKQLQGRAQLTKHLRVICTACAGCYNAAALLCARAPEQQTDAKQQRWRYEQQLWLLLPSMLLSSASNLLRLSVSMPLDPLQQHMERECLAGLLEQSGQALVTYSRLHRRFGGVLLHASADAWMHEVLRGVLQLADQLLQQQQQSGPGHVQAPAAATATASAAAVGHSQSSSRTQAAPASSRYSRTQKCCEAELVALLSMLVYESRRWFLSSSAETGDSIGPAFGDAEASVANPSSSSFCVPTVAERFVEVCTALQAGLRAVTTAVQRSTVELPPTFVRFCLLGLLSGDSDGDRLPLALHMDLRGPAASVQLRQFYSMLSTVQKLGCFKTENADELCWGQQVADMCCWAAAQAAVGLLKAALLDGSAAAVPAGGRQLQATPEAAAEQLQLEAEYLVGNYAVAAS